jgi:hypothetical protein
MSGHTSVRYCSLVLGFALLVARTLAGDAAALDDLARCKRNLHLIYDAIEAYRLAHQDLPELISELYPAFLADSDILSCPQAKKRALTSVTATGRLEFADPKTSYFYEFRNIPLPTMPGRTNRDWKRAQMGLLGSDVPIVRCLLHERPLSLSFGGEIYESALDWEYRFTNVVRYSDLMEEHLLAPVPPVRVVQIPPRGPDATVNQIDLSEWYNASLRKTWIERPREETLASLPTGLQQLGAVLFEVRGVVQFSSRNLARMGGGFPERITIPVGRTFRELHLLLGSSGNAENGLVAGRIDVQFREGKIESIPIRMGYEVRPTWKADSANRARPAVAWQSPPPLSARLYQLSWPNPHPSIKGDAITFTGSTNAADFFLVALTLKP